MLLSRRVWDNNSLPPLDSSPPDLDDLHELAIQLLALAGETGFISSEDTRSEGNNDNTSCTSEEEGNIGRWICEFPVGSLLAYGRPHLDRIPWKKKEKKHKKNKKIKKSKKGKKGSKEDAAELENSLKNSIAEHIHQTLEQIEELIATCDVCSSGDIPTFLVRSHSTISPTLESGQMQG